MADRDKRYVYRQIIIAHARIYSDLLSSLRITYLYQTRRSKMMIYAVLCCVFTSMLIGAGYILFGGGESPAPAPNPIPTESPTFMPTTAAPTVAP
jgi:hypothetical protein